MITSVNITWFYGFAINKYFFFCVYFPNSTQVVDFTSKGLPGV